ncbi:MAG: OmpH family outer membrane protein [Chlorobi bacterium]|nr:OmpH family outer membrane protein [Chlorobiota bacterium]
MRKIVLGIATVIIALFVTSCDKGNNKPNNTQATNGSSFKFAYVMTDTLSGAYEYFTDLQSDLMIEQQEKEAELNSRYKALQNKYLKIQRDVQNRMMTPSTAQKKQEQLAIQQQKLQQDQQIFQAELMEKTQKMTLEVLDSIKNYIKIYNKDHHYNLVITSDTLGSQLLYADKEFDITEDIIKGLNKRYRASLNNTDEKKEDK